MYFSFNEYFLIFTYSFIGILYLKFNSFVIISNENNRIIAIKINDNDKNIDILFNKLDKII